MIVLEFTLIAKSAIGEKQHVESTERFLHRGELRERFCGCAIERPSLGIIRTACFQVLGDGVEPSDFAANVTGSPCARNLN